MSTKKSTSERMRGVQRKTFEVQMDGIQYVFHVRNIAPVEKDAHALTDALHDAIVETLSSQPVTTEQSVEEGGKANGKRGCA